MPIRAILNFYPRSPCGERPDTHRRSDIRMQFLSTLSLRRATGITSCTLTYIKISIHALLAESDLLLLCLLLIPMLISIHALLAESDSLTPEEKDKIERFLSTLSLRRATAIDKGESSHCHISIHALLAESDNPVRNSVVTNALFLSTLSLRRATYTDLNSAYGALISIHALLAESDDWPPVRDIIQWISIHALLAESDSLWSKGRSHHW